MIDAKVVVNQKILITIEILIIAGILIGCWREYNVSILPPTPNKKDWISQESFHLGMGALNYGKNWNTYSKDTSLTIEMLDNLKERGINWVGSVRFQWDDGYGTGVEPEPDIYDFSFYDWLVSEVEKRNMCIEGGIPFWYNDWYDPSVGLTEEQLNEYCKAIEKTLRHFKGKPIVWEFALGTDHTPEHTVNKLVEQMAKIYEAARKGDPDAYIIISPQVHGTRVEKIGEKWYELLSAFYEGGIRPDAIGFRSYSSSAFELDSTIKAFKGHLEKIQNTYGVSYDLWGMEIGLHGWVSIEKWEEHSEELEKQGYVKEDFSYASEAQHITTRMFTLAANNVKFSSWHSYISYVTGRRGETRPTFEVYKTVSEALSGKFEVADKEIQVSLPEDEVTAHFFKKEDSSYILVLWNTDGYPTRRWFERKKWKELPTNDVEITLPLETGAGKVTRITYGSSPEDSSFVESSDFSFSNGKIKTTIEKGEVIIYQFYCVGEEENPDPKQYLLYQNCPNPFISSTSIRYSIAKSAQVKLKIYNVAGQLVKTLVNGEQKAGTYKIEWNGKDEKSRFMPSGIYFVKLKVGDFSQTKKLLILR